MAMIVDLSDLPAGVDYYPAESWGLTRAEAERRGLAVQPMGLPEGYVHHSAGSTPDLTPATWDDDPVAYVAWMDRYARETKGYKALDYSDVIHRAPSGRVSIVEGRAEYYPAATKDRNSVSKALCFIGSFDSRSGPTLRREPSELEIAAAQWWWTARRRAGYITTTAVLRPHRDNPSHPDATSCCGDRLIPLVPTIAKGWVPHPVPAPAPEFPAGPFPPPPTPEEVDAMGIIGYFVGSPGLVLWTGLGWRYIRSRDGDAGRMEIAELEFMGQARRGPDGHPVALPAAWRFEYPQVAA